MRHFPFRADWIDLRFLHFRVEAPALQPFVPHPLDLFDGAAWVSLVAFEQSRFRPVGTGALGAALFKPLASHPFLNVRTYVRCHGEPGIFFLAEWVPLRLAAYFGPRTWGLPYRLGALDYQQDAERGISNCKVTGNGILQFRCESEPGLPATTASPGSREEFLLERYAAFTQRCSRPYAFRIAHPPWLTRESSAVIASDSLLTGAFPWYRAATFLNAHVSAVMFQVSLGAPQRLGERVSLPVAEARA